MINLKYKEKTLSKERDTLVWLNGVLDAISDDDSLKAGGDHNNFVRISRKTFNRIRQKIANELETENENENQTLLRG